MTTANEPICVATGTLIEVQMWSAELKSAGIEHKVVGDELATSFGTALQGSVELWVHAQDARKAEEIIAAYEAESEKKRAEGE